MTPAVRARTPITIADLIGALVEPLGYAFFVRGLAAAVVVGAVSAVIGSFIVVRGMAFFGDALAHAVLPGVAVGYIIGRGESRWLLAGGLAAAVLASLGIGAISERRAVKEDTAIGIVFAGMFALGVALISRQRSYAVDLTHILFGDVLGVSSADLQLVVLLGGAVVLVVFLLYKELVLISFDPLEAETQRLPTRALTYLLLGLIAVTVVVSLQTVGVALMVAMLVTPAATAFLLTQRLARMMALGALFGAASGVIGLYGSYFLGVASGAAIVLTATALFGLAFVLVPTRERLLALRAARGPDETVRR